MWWMPLAIGGAQFAGSLINKATGGSGPRLTDEEAQRVRDQFSNNFESAPVSSAEAGAQSISNVTHDPLGDALARQEYMRQQQQRYMGDLRAVAMGERSLAREQAALEQQRLQSAIMGQASGARGRYAQLASRRAAPTQSSLVGARMVAPTNAAAEQERDQAMNAYAQALSQMGQQDSAAYMNYLQQLRTRQEGLLGGEALQQYGYGQSTTDQEQRAKDALNQGVNG